MTADFRSDTVTRPTEAMRRAMAAAEVGDDVFGDDPTVRRLEERVAALLGKEAALFLPSGTMANQVALGVLGRRGEEVLLEASSHTFHFEAGGAAALWGMQPRLYESDRGVPDPQAITKLLRPENVHFCRTAAYVIENTHNLHGGRVVPLDVVRAVRKALPASVKLHLDGARLWNAHAATGVPLRDLAAPADTVMVAFSKGLCCPAGSVLASTRDAIHEARRLRKLLGGGMRQVGVLAAPALVALDEGFGHLEKDHARAKRLAEGLGVDPAEVETNIVFVPVHDARSEERRLAESGVLATAIGPDRLRFVTHRDVDDAAVDRAISAFSR